MWWLACLLAVQVLDVEMTPAEQKQTGISRLSEKEKGELQSWIDQHYARRAEPLAQKTVPASSKAMLQDNFNNGTYLRLSDGSIWNIRPSDIPLSQSWITPVDIHISQSGDPTYPYKLTNSITGSSVLARKVDKLPDSSSSAPTTPQIKK